jgi:DNA-binding response OmpR family regulator
MGRVLVVDDDPAMSALIELHLQRGGHDVLVANSPQDALTMAAGPEVPEVVVLDVAMPDMSGFELLIALRDLEHLSALPAVFLSALVTAPDLESGRNLGATYLTKPFVASALLMAVDRQLADAALVLCVILERRMAERGPEQSMTLTEHERLALERLSGGHNAAQAIRARVVLACAKSHAEVANH